MRTGTGPPRLDDQQAIEGIAGDRLEVAHGHGVLAVDCQLLEASLAETRA
ncbi:MAG: hypothetical protein ACLGIF_02655 [Actinomycetes bacterium]